MKPEPDDLRRWVANHEAVNARVRGERESLTPAESLRKAVRASALHQQVAGGRPTSSLEEVLSVHRTWVKLRSVLRATD